MATVTAIGFLALLGAVVAGIGGTPVLKSVWRLTYWGTLAMGITAVVGSCLARPPDAVQVART